MQRQPRGPVDNEKYYKILGVEKNADENDIKKAYKKKALKEHPDRGGSEEKFKEISRAYEVLSDPQTKRLYDTHGEEGLEEGGGMSAQEMFFGGRFRGQETGPIKTKSLIHKLKVSLEDLCNGKSCHLAINRTRINDAKEAVKERRLLEVHVEKGMRDGQKITFAGESNEAPGCIPGDVIFVLEQAKHKTFHRKGNDLLMKKEITLTEALCGYDFIITHLDGRRLNAKAEPGEITEEGQVKVIENEGMPLLGSGGFQRGRLFVVFKIKFPKQGEFSVNTISQLRGLLRTAKSQADKKDVGRTGEEEEVTLTVGDVDEFGTNDDYRDEDDEGGRGGAQQVQCQNM